MFNTSAEERKQVMKGVVALDEDDIQDLPAMNEKVIKKLIRDLQNGEKIDISQISKQKLGNFKRDIISAILLHKYDSLETAIGILRQLYDCAIDFVKILNQSCVEAQKQFSKLLIQEEGNDKLVIQQERHIYFTLSAAAAGFDKNNKTLWSVLKLIQNQLTTLCLYVSTFLQSGQGVSQLSSKIRFNLADYFISMHNIFTETNNALFVPQDQFGSLVESLSIESVTQMCGSGTYQGSMSGETGQQVQQYFAYFPEIVKQLVQSFGQLNSDAFRESRRFQDVKDQILYKTLIKELSYATKQINELIRIFGSNKTIRVLQLLTPKDEMMLLQYIDPEFEKIYKIYSFRSQTQVEDEIDELEKIQLLYSSNATLVELQFAYPYQKYLKFQIEQLTDLNINQQIDILQKTEKIHLLDYIDLLMNKAKSNDDVEYLACALYKESPCTCDSISSIPQGDDTENVSICALHVCLARFLQNFWRRGQISKAIHLINCFYYNGFHVYYQLVDVSSAPDSQGVKTNRDIIEFLLHFRVQNSDDTHWLSRVLATLLERRLVSTQQILDVIRRCSQSKDDNKRERLSFTRQLIKNISKVASMLDENFCERVKRLLGLPESGSQSSKGNQQAIVSNKTERLSDKQYQLTILQEAMNDLEIQKQQTEVIKKCIQAELERRERQEKREAYMKKLKQTNEKLYRQELEKDRKRQEELLEKQKAEALKNQQKQQKQPKKKQNNDIPHIIKDLLQQQQTTNTNSCISQLVTVPVNWEELRAQARDLSRVLYAMKKGGDDAKLSQNDGKNTGKALQKLLLYLQTTINLNNVVLYSHIYAVILDDMMIGKQIKALNYKENVFKNKSIDKQVCLIKFLLLFAGLESSDFINDVITPANAGNDQLADINDIQQLTKELLRSIKLLKTPTFHNHNYISSQIPQSHIYQIFTPNIDFKNENDVEGEVEMNTLVWKVQMLLLSIWLFRSEEVLASVILIYGQIQSTWCALQSAFSASLRHFGVDEWNAGTFVREHFNVELHEIVENDVENEIEESSGLEELYNL